MLCVPFLSSDWLTVRDCFKKGTIQSYKSAMAIINTWKLRSPKGVPMAAEITEYIVRALLAEMETSTIGVGVDHERWFQQESVRLIQSMALIRFVNYVNEMSANDRFREAIRTAVRRVDVPNWIVELRHAAAHQHMPEASLLSDAIHFCRQWLWDKYWNASKPPTSDLETASRMVDRGTTTVMGRMHNALTNFEAYRRHQVMVADSEDGDSSTQHGQTAYSKSLNLIAKRVKMQPTQFLKMFVSERHLILNEEQLQNWKWELIDDAPPPCSLQQFWSPVLALLKRETLMARLLHTLLTRLAAAGNDVTRRQIRSWTLIMVNAYLQDSTWTDKQWRKILTSILVVADQFDRDLLQSIAAKVTSLSDTHRTTLLSLVDVYLGEDDQTAPSVGDKLKSILNSQHHTVADLVAAIERKKLAAKQQGDAECSMAVLEEGFDDCSFRLDDQYDWGSTETPLGLLPGQSAATLNLALDFGKRPAPEPEDEPPANKKRKQLPSITEAAESKLDVNDNDEVLLLDD